MALIIPSSTWPLTKKPHPLLHSHLFHSSRIPSFFSSIKSQESSSSSSTEPPKSAAGDGSSSAVTRPPKTQPSAGEGFGSSSAKSNVNPAGTKKKQKGKRERASIIRRAPLEKPRFASSQQEEAQVKELASNESAFLLAWLGIGAIVLLEGIALAASGFLPEEWDNFFVKFLYPSFTPTVFFFVAGTVAYGVFKYLQNEKLKSEK